MTMKFVGQQQGRLRYRDQRFCQHPESICGRLARSSRCHRKAVLHKEADVRRGRTIEWRKMPNAACTVGVCFLVWLEWPVERSG